MVGEDVYTCILGVLTDWLNRAIHGGLYNTKHGIHSVHTVLCLQRDPFMCPSLQTLGM
jgi:hypothetical protein